MLGDGGLHEGDGSGERPLSGLLEEPLFHEQTISPDGKKIAFTGHSRLENGYDDDHFVTDLDLARGVVSNLLRLISDSREDMHPSWSPDGKRIAYSSVDQGATSPNGGSTLEKTGRLRARDPRRRGGDPGLVGARERHLLAGWREDPVRKER